MLLKLLAMNPYDMEENNRMERLVSFKAAYGNSIRAMVRLLKKFCPQMDKAERQRRGPASILRMREPGA